jgi:hypothetical protein
MSDPGHVSEVAPDSEKNVPFTGIERRPSAWSNDADDPLPNYGSVGGPLARPLIVTPKPVASAEEPDHE